MVEHPEIEDFRRRIDGLRTHPLLRRCVKKDIVELSKLSVQDIRTLIKNEAGYYFLITAAGLNRTSVKKAMQTPAAKIVAAGIRRAHVIKARLPYRASFETTTARAVGLRGADIGRKGRGQIEQLFRDRLAAEGIPVFMSPPVRPIPGLLVADRKPDGVYPDPKSGLAPRLYFEIKNVQRVADDIQKRLYEMAEASIEMKTIYGNLLLRGLDLKTTRDVRLNPELQQRIRTQITASPPAVVVLLLCSKSEAEKYRPGAETFVDRVFFQEEIEECLAYLKRITTSAT